MTHPMFLTLVLNIYLIFFLSISLSSHHTVIKAFSPLKHMDENYKKQPSVTFIGEPGIDAGGLTR